jgi:CHAD domain-containing protein
MKQLAVRWAPSEDAVVNAARVIPKLLRDYFQAGRKLDEDSNGKDLHAFRLKTKRLRYTLETFVPLFGARFEEKMQTLRPIQNALGDLNDCEVLLTDLRHRVPREARSCLEKRQKEKLHEFLRYWREEFDTADAGREWESQLKRAGRKAPVRT